MRTTNRRLLGTNIYQGPVPVRIGDYCVKPAADKLGDPIALFACFEDAWDYATLGEYIKNELTQTFQRKCGPTCFDDNGKLITRS